MSFSVDIDDYGDADVMTFENNIMHKIGKVKAATKQMSQVRGALDAYLYKEFNNSLGTSTHWLSGANCEILRVDGKEWKKGKLKFELTVKFYPDEPDEQELPTSNRQEVNQAEPSHIGQFEIVNRIDCDRP